jgi:hypothetical protein
MHPRLKCGSKVLSEQDIDELEALSSLQPKNFLSLLDNIRSRPLLCQRIEDWYRSQFPQSKATFYVI